MGSITTYIVLIIGVTLGVISNSAAKSANGFTILLPSIISSVTIIMCMVSISFVSKTPSSRFAHQTLSPCHLFKVNTHVDIFSNYIPRWIY